MHAQDECGLLVDGVLVVGGSRAVRRADLDEPCARAREHVGDPEAVADLDQLAAGDEDLASLGERREREQHRRGVVVHDECGFRAGQPPQDRGDVILAGAACALREVVLEVRIAAAGLDGMLEGRGRERRPAEVRVEDHPGRVQDAAQGRATGRVELGE